RRDFQGDFRLRVVLASDGEVAVVAAAGLRGGAFGYSQLNHDMRRRDLAGGSEELMKDGRSDVVGQIAVHAAALSRAVADVAANICFTRFVHPASEIELEDVARDDFHIR